MVMGNTAKKEIPTSATTSIVVGVTNAHTKSCYEITFKSLRLYVD